MPYTSNMVGSPEGGAAFFRVGFRAGSFLPKVERFYDKAVVSFLFVS